MQTKHAVIIVGGGPTGLMLAGELALAHVDLAIVERRATQDLAGRRAGGLHARTLEELDQRGIAERFVAQGQIYRKPSPGLGWLDVSDAPTRYNYLLALAQEPIERTLAAWVTELGIRIHRGVDGRGVEVTDVAQDGTGVDVALSDGRSLRAQYLVGCDGGRSLVRRKAGIDFPGWDASTSYLIAEGEPGTEPPWGVRHGERGVNALGKLDEGKRVGIVLVEPNVRQTADPSEADLREALLAVYGTDFGLRNVTYLSRFTDMARQAATYRSGRVLLAGDAAHVHSPNGGQGLNIGVQDAVNLGWKLAQVIHGTSSKSLLDTYQAERHPIGAQLLRNTLALTALNRGDARSEALRGLWSEMLATDAARRRYAGMMSGLDIHYDLQSLGDGRPNLGNLGDGHPPVGETLGDGHPHVHPLLGRRMPDLDLIAAGGPLRVFTLLHEARPILLNLGEPGVFDTIPRAERVRLIDARTASPWELPVIGAVAAPRAVLIRPDGYVAWVGDGTDHGLREALSTWF